MDGPLVSIIVPVYNAEKYVCKCIDSILSQTYRNIEVLLINDGSIDKSEDLIEKYYVMDSRVKYISKKNEGVSKTRNCGISRAKGAYAAFVDADDWIDESFVEEALKYMQDYDLDFVLGGTQKVFDKHCEDYKVSTSEKIVIYDSNLNEFIAKVLSNGIIKNSPINSCFTSGPVCKLFRTQVIETVMFDEELVVGEDTVFNLKVLERTSKIGVVPQIWYYYRMNNASVTQAFNPEIKLQTEKLISTLITMFYHNEQLKPYLIVRGIQQFHMMLLLYPLNHRSGMGLLKQREFIKDCLKNDVWVELFINNALKKLPANRFDKYFAWLCFHQMSIALILLIKVRLLAKRIL